jgi:hypothetical protein
MSAPLWYGDATLEIEGNSGTVTLNASSAQDALVRARRFFRHMRDISVTGTAERYVIEFKVSFKYNRRLFRRASKLAKLDLTRENYERLEPTEKYIALLYAQVTGKETFLSDPMFLRGALLSLKNEMLHQGQVSSPDDFTDYDIAVYNLVESQS